VAIYTPGHLRYSVFITEAVDRAYFYLELNSADRIV